MKDCLSFLAVEYMRMGFSPHAACRAAVARAHAHLTDKQLPVAVLAINKRGEHGGCGSGDDPFVYAVWRADSNVCEMVTASYENGN